MPLNLEDKKALVAEVAELAAKSQSVVAAQYRGLTVTQMTELRAKARAKGVQMRVVKNTLARKAMVGTSFEAVGPQLKGPLVLAFSKDDPRRSCAGDQGLCESQRQAGCDSDFDRWPGAAGFGSGKSRIPADARTGSVDALGYAQGTDREVRADAGRAAYQAGPHCCGGTGCAPGRGRLMSINLSEIAGENHGC